MALRQVPPNLEVWRVGRSVYLVRMIDDLDPPIPLIWLVPDAEEAKALGIGEPDRIFGSMTELRKTGALNHGTTRELVNTTEDPWDAIQSNYETEVKVKPWLRDPEILALWYASALEGRGMTQAELQGTEWWRTHTRTEREWLSLNASDPATAERIIADNRARVSDLLQSAGISNAGTNLINAIADNWTTGAWSEIYATNQIRLLSDPNLQGDLDKSLRSFRKGLDGTRAGEQDVRDLIETWLGPAGKHWTDKNISLWATRLREDPDARLELTEALRSQRLALFPEYTNERLTYEDIAAPWRNVWAQQWGGVADEEDPLFSRIVRMNDVAGAEQLLRTEGLARGNRQVSQSLLGDVTRSFGDGVRRADAAIV